MSDAVSRRMVTCERLQRQKRLLVPSPLVLLTAVWGSILLCRHLPMVEFTPLREDVCWFLFFCYLAFAAAYLTTRHVRFSQRPDQNAPKVSSAVPVSLRYVILAFAVLGAIGSLTRAVDLLFLRGIDYSAGFSAARLSNIAMVEETGAGMRPLSAIGKMLMGCSSVAMLVAVLRFERITARLAGLAAASWGLLLLLSIVEGGRNTIVTNLLFVFSSGLVRWREGKRPLPFPRRIRILAGCTLLTVGGYVIHVFVDRFAALGYTDHTVIVGIESAFSVEVADWFKALPASRAKNGLLGFFMVVIYVGHGVDQLGPLLDWVGDNAIGFGRYNLDLVVIALQRAGLPIAPFDFARLPNSGLYFSAPGEVLLDFGRVGAMLCLAGLGALVGNLWQKVYRQERLLWELLLCFALSWILASPLYSIFSGFLGVFLAMLIFRFAIIVIRTFRSRA